jgi:hypothetical protein
MGHRSTLQLAGTVRKDDTTGNGPPQLALQLANPYRIPYFTRNNAQLSRGQRRHLYAR